MAKKEQKNKYKKLQLYYYFTIGREYLNLSIPSNYQKRKIRKQLVILNKLDIPHVLGEEKILSPNNMTDWVENLYQYRLELKSLGIMITPKTRLACAAQRVVRLFGLDIVYLYRRTQNGRLVSHFRGASSHSDADKSIMNGWLERDLQAAEIGRLDGN